MKKGLTHIVLAAALSLTTAACSLFPEDQEYARINPNPAHQANPTVGSYQVPGFPQGEPAPQVDYNTLKAPNRPPPLGTTNFIPVAPESFMPTGTLASKKVQQLRDDLILLQNSIVEQNQLLQGVRNKVQSNTQLYHSLVASINTRLQVGTTPGNPELISQWNQAQNQLERINSNIAELNNLSNSVAGSATLSGYLLDSVKAAYGLSGAVDEDHRQLGILENDVNRTIVLVDRLLAELSRDVSRQSNYMANEQDNLRALSLAIKNGELYGRSLSYQPRAFSAPALAAAPVRPGMMAYAPTSVTAQPLSQVDEPLVIIRFEEKNVNYQRPLYDAVSRALQRKPNVSFELVAVTPRGGSAATFSMDSMKSERQVEDVLRTLREMGISEGRVQVNAQQAGDVDSNEVRLYVR